jgi:integrase/recombinase XerD
MRDHLALMRAMGYRYVSQEVRFAAFDRFLQARPDLTDQSLSAMVQAWSQFPPTIAHAWYCAEFGAELQIRQQYRRPYIYSPTEISRIL